MGGLGGRPPGEACATIACGECGAAFVCGAAAGLGRCWCSEVPGKLPVPHATGGVTCLCRECLLKRLNATAPPGDGGRPVKADECTPS